MKMCLIFIWGVSLDCLMNGINEVFILRYHSEIFHHLTFATIYNVNNHNDINNFLSVNMMLSCQLFCNIEYHMYFTI